MRAKVEDAMVVGKMRFGVGGSKVGFYLCEQSALCVLAEFSLPC
jgi:hypothetical protein